MFEDFDEKQLVKIFGLISFLSVVLGLFVYFLLFPVNCGSKGSTAVIGVDPIAFKIAQEWNKANLGVTEFPIDSCNKAVRVSEFVWQVEMKEC